MKVLVIRLSAMGDVAISAPVMKAVCRENPNVQFDFLSTPRFEPFFEPMPNFNFISTEITKTKGTAAIWRLYRTLKDAHYNAIVDLHNVLRTKILRLLFLPSSTPTFVIRKGYRDKYLLARPHRKRLRQLKPTIERYCDVFRSMGLAVAPLETRPAQPMPATNFLPTKNNEKWIGIAPFAQHKGKVYPTEKMQIAVAKLCQTDNIRVLIFGGGKSEKSIAETWEQKYARCHSVIDKLPLADELRLISNLDCVISMDSSTMHMASLYGVRVVSVWGATHPFAGFLGFGQNDSDVVQLPLKCRPCSVYGKKPCRYGDYHCFDIAPEEIVERALHK